MGTDAHDDKSIDELVGQGQLVEAAQRCAASGKHKRAAQLFERACEFGQAAEQALCGGELARAATLAALHGDPQLQQRVLQAVLASAELELSRRIAADLSARGHHRNAAELYRGSGAHQQAAEAFARAGAVLEAAECFEQADQPAEAARALEAALRRGGTAAASLATASDAAMVDRVRLALGRLYARHGRHEPAVRVLQQLSTDSPLRRDALPAMALALEHLGLRQALHDIHAELRSYGIDPSTVADAVESQQPADGSPPGAARLYGRYDVVREVATTPHARVVEAVDRLTGESVAVKVFASRLRGTGRDALQRFAREAKVLMQLRHPNVVPLRAFIAEGPAMVLDWMAGGSLRDLIDREPISPGRAAEIAAALLGALAEAHRVGILHRDVKPSNLLFDEGGTAKLADFGAAHWSDSAATVTAAEIGTVAYMAPEQIRGGAATVRSDIYSAGVLLFEMLTQRRPEASCVVSSYHPDLDETHDALLQKMLAPEPVDRFEEALAARHAIESLAWSTRIVESSAAPMRPTAAKPLQATRTERLVEPREGGHPTQRAWLRHDTWLKRDVLVLPLDETTRLRAAAFARAGHPALPTVLRADADASEVWIDAARGESLRRLGGPLTESELSRLREALHALHELGAAHGNIDADHVYRHAGTVFLAWPRHPAAEASAADDERALAALGTTPE